MLERFKSKTNLRAAKLAALEKLEKPYIFFFCVPLAKFTPIDLLQSCSIVTFLPYCTKMKLKAAYNTTPEMHQIKIQEKFRLLSEDWALNRAKI